MCKCTGSVAGSCVRAFAFFPLSLTMDILLATVPVAPATGAPVKGVVATNPLHPAIPATASSRVAQVKAERGHPISRSGWTTCNVCYTSTPAFGAQDLVETPAGPVCECGSDGTFKLGRNAPPKQLGEYLSDAARTAAELVRRGCCHGLPRIMEPSSGPSPVDVLNRLRSRTRHKDHTSAAAQTFCPCKQRRRPPM